MVGPPMCARYDDRAARMAGSEGGIVVPARPSKLYAMIYTELDRASHYNTKSPFPLPLFGRHQTEMQSR